MVETPVKNTEENSVSVVHLIWLPLGPSQFNNFILSYCKYNSGYPHQLVLLFNGVSNIEEISDYLRIMEDTKIPYETLIHYGQCQDLDAYFWAADQLKSNYLLFLNGYSQFLADNWLEKYMKHAGNQNIGIIGATGSWQSYYRSVFINNKWNWQKNLSLNENVRKFKLLLKAYFYWRFLFPDFPNPHIRTNAFMIRRNLLISLKHRPLSNKFSAYTLESGFNNITAQIFKKGLEAVVIDRFGNGFMKKEWASRKIFWTDQQEDLLVSDNQTRKYDLADPETRARLSYHAWGSRDPSSLIN